MKSINRSTKHLNTYKNLLLHIEPNQNSFIPVKNDNTSNYFINYNKN